MVLRRQSQDRLHCETHLERRREGKDREGEGREGRGEDREKRKPPPLKTH
jgi:hypothetical protein